MLASFRSKLICSRSLLLHLILIGCGASRAREGESADAIAPGTGTMQTTTESVVGSNLIKNGDFDEGVLSPWLQSVSSPARGSFRVDQGMACTQILAAGENSYDI